jgi:hypothetical protein
MPVNLRGNRVLTKVLMAWFSAKAQRWTRKSTKWNLLRSFKNGADWIYWNPFEMQPGALRVLSAAHYWSEIPYWSWRGLNRWLYFIVAADDVNAAQTRTWRLFVRALNPMQEMSRELILTRPENFLPLKNFVFGIWAGKKAAELGRRTHRYPFRYRCNEATARGSGSIFRSGLELCPANSIISRNSSNRTMISRPRRNGQINESFNLRNLAP